MDSPTLCSNSFVSANNRFHAPFQFESAKECKWNSIIDLEGVISATKSPFFKVSHFNERCANLCSVTNFVSWKFQGFRVSCFIFHKNTLTVWQILNKKIINLWFPSPLWKKKWRKSSRFNVVALVSWVSRNIWRDWDQENDPETRPVWWSRISAAATNIL